MLKRCLCDQIPVVVVVVVVVVDHEDDDTLGTLLLLALHISDCICIFGFI